MKKLLFVLLAVGLFVFCDQKAKKEPAQQATEEKAKASLSAAWDSVMALSAKEPKNIVVDFYTDWCSWCKKLDTVTFSDSTVQEFMKDFYFVKINAEVDSLLVRKFGIVGYPTVVICRSDGSEYDRFHFEKPEDFIRKVNDYLNGVGTLDALLAQEKEKPEDLQLKLDIAEKYIYRNKMAEAKGYGFKVLEADPENKQGLNQKALLGIADAFRRSDELDSAIVYCKTVLEKYPDAKEAHDAQFYMGYYNLKKDDKESARKHWEEFLKKYPDSRDVEYVQKKLKKLEKEAAEKK